MSNASGSPPDASARPRVIFLGMPCAFSTPPLAALVAAGLDVAAVVLPGPPGGEPFRWHHPPRRTKPAIDLSNPAGGSTAPSVMVIAHRANIPLLFAASVRSPAVVAEISRLQPDAVAVVCYPERLPAALLALPRLGALNIHPSLLPRDRGPSPLFWAFHRGADETGVTVHLMEELLDTGPIVVQRAVPIAEGSRLDDVELELATLGGELLVEALLARSGGNLRVTAQDPAMATGASFPTPDDAVVDPAAWSAGRALRFVRGVRAAAVRLPNGDLVPVIDALRPEPTMTPVASDLGEQNSLDVAFKDGTVTFQLPSSDRTT